MRVRPVGEGEHELWAQTSARGRSDSGYGDFMLGFARVGAKRQDAFSFLAESDGRPAATGALSVHEGVALPAGSASQRNAERRGFRIAYTRAKWQLTGPAA